MANHARRCHCCIFRALWRMGRSFVTPELWMCGSWNLIAFLDTDRSLFGSAWRASPEATCCRRAQYRVADSESMSLSIARSFVLGKITNIQAVSAACEADECRTTRALAAVCDRPLSIFLSG